MPFSHFFFAINRLQAWRRLVGIINAMTSYVLRRQNLTEPDGALVKV